MSSCTRPSGFGYTQPMSDDFKVRKHPRYSLSWSVRVYALDWDEKLPMETVDLSRGGAFIQTSRAFDVGTQLQLTFIVPERDSQVEVFSKVVRIVDEAAALEKETAAGIGVEFLRPSMEFRALLDELLASKPAPAPAADGPEFLSMPTASMDDAEGPTMQVGKEWYKDGLDELRKELKIKQGADPEEAMTPAEKLAAARRFLAEDKYADAQRLAQMLLDVDDSNKDHQITMHLAAAGLHKEAGRIEDAVLHWRDAVAKDPECEPAIRGLRAAGFSKTGQKKFFASLMARLSSMFGGG